MEDKRVVSLRRSAEGYQIHLEDGEAVAARKVIVAVGLNYYNYVPPILSSLPKTHASHSAEYGTVDHFKGREVVVVGAGASALDLAALLHQVGARVQVVARTPVIRLWDPPAPMPTTLIQWLRNPMTDLGRGWRLFWCANAPLVFRLMPEQFRLDKVRRILGPAPGWFVKQEVVGKVPLHLGFSITDAKALNGDVRLQIADGTGAGRTIEAEHVIAATGYRVDLRRLSFLDGNDLAQIRTVENTPVLSANFESSLPGLYFVGTSAANTFGPLLRFACGAGFTARRLARHLAK
jgi:thioredoxin reductase